MAVQKEEGRGNREEGKVDRRLLLNTPTLLLLVACAIAISGCRPVGLAYSHLQFRNTELQLGEARMTIRAGDGKADGGKLMDAESYAGVYHLGRVAVRYPEGSRETAVEVARAMADTANLVAARMGIEWSFRLEVRLARISDDVKGFTYSVPLKRDRLLVFPMFLDRSGRIRAKWAPVVAHEVTEASMLAPVDRRKLVLGDLSAGKLCVSTGARWFRDGVSDRAGYIAGSRLFAGRFEPSAAGYRELAEVREAVLEWANCADAPNYYDASAALVMQAENAVGEYAVAQIMDRLSHRAVPSGGAVRGAFSGATGLELPDYPRSYRAPWLGVELANTAPDFGNHPLVLPGNQVVVRRVYNATPAARWKLATGDIIESAAGEEVRSADHLGHIIARHRPGDRLELRVRRGADSRAMRVKLAAM